MIYTPRFLFPKFSKRSTHIMSDHILPTTTSGVGEDYSRILQAKEAHSRLLRAKEAHLARQAQESPLDDSASESSLLRNTEDSMITDDSMISESSVPEGYAQVKVFMDPMGKGAMENQDSAAKERWSWSTSTTGATGKTIQTMESGASASMVRNIFVLP